MSAFDYKKAYRDLYLPKAEPDWIDVPEMKFFAVDGAGDPNTSASYAEALEILYGLSYAVKMSKRGGSAPEGYFDYVVPPLEGLWETDEAGFDGSRIAEKGKFRWTSLIRQPEFVTDEAFAAAKRALAAKKPGLDLSRAKFFVWREGLCAQILHVGSYDDEPATIARLSAFIAGQNREFDGARRHHEIYLGDPRRTAAEKLRTVIRHPVRPR